MNRRMALLLTAAVVTVGLFAVAIQLFKKDPSPADAVSGSPPEAAEEGAEQSATLYLPAESGMLEAETRAAPGHADTASRMRWLAEQLLAGPQGEGLGPALPEGTQVASVFAALDGTVFVDFTLPSEGVGMGSTEEILALYSVVNTLVLDDERTQRVVILLNGRQRDTLAGHVDTSRPLAARRDLIREAE